MSVDKKSRHHVEFLGTGILGDFPEEIDSEKLVGAFQSITQPYEAGVFEVDFGAKSPFRCFEGANYLGGLCRVEIEMAATDTELPPSLLAKVLQAYGEKFRHIMDLMKLPHLSVSVEPVRRKTWLRGGDVEDEISCTFLPDSSIHSAVFSREINKGDFSVPCETGKQLRPAEGLRFCSHILTHALENSRKLTQKELDQLKDQSNSKGRGR